MYFDIKHFTCDANEAVNIIFIKSPEDMNNKKEMYKPKMTHQIFENESIFGYSELRVNLYYSCYTFHCYIEICYEEIWDENFLGLKPDNIINSLSPWLRDAMILNKSDFINILNTCNKSNIRFGEILHEFNHKVLSKNLFCSVTLCDITNNDFIKLHQRFESLIIMYIDAANFIDMTDHNWKVIYLYRKKIISSHVICYIPIGFCTIYIFNNKKIGRISQFFIMPMYQRKGLGFIFLTTIYEYLREDVLNIKTITVESPNELFTDLRDKVDVIHCLDLPVFGKNEIKGGFTNKKYNKILSDFKLSEKQAKKVYEIIRAYYCELGIDDYEDFKADFIKDCKIEMFGLDAYPESEREHHLHVFENHFDVDNISLNKTFDSFVKSIQNVLKYLRGKGKGFSVGV